MRSFKMIVTQQLIYTLYAINKSGLISDDLEIELFPDKLYVNKSAEISSQVDEYPTVFSLR